MSINKPEEPTTAPYPDRWYPLSLGPSFKDTNPNSNPTSKFCTLRYEFKPASIDKTQPGKLHKTKDNKINVEFNNNQLGKPKLTFQGTSEDYKENDAVLFFDGRHFRLERLHRAVKRLRHVRLPGELTAGSGSSGNINSNVDSPPPNLPPPPPGPVPAHVVGMGRGGGKGPAHNNVNVNSQRGGFNPPPPPPPPPPVHVEVERIDIGDAGNSGGAFTNDKPNESPLDILDGATTPDSKDFDLEEQLNMIDEDDDATGPDKSDGGDKQLHTGIDINVPHHNDTDEEIADVDANDANGGIGRSAAEALRAQVNAVERVEQTSSSSASSESSSESSSGSGSGSGSSDSDSESSDGDSVNSI